MDLGLEHIINIDDAILLIRLALVLILTSFILLSGFLLPMYLRGQQQQELERIKKVSEDISHTSLFISADSANPPFRLLSYLTPVLFTAFIVFLFATISLFGANGPTIPDFILAGTKLWELGGVNKGGNLLGWYESGTLSMIIFAFFGVFIWSVQYILGRVMTRDIAPAEFYKISINMIFAIILAVAIRHSLTAIFSGSAVDRTVEDILPTVGFLVGLFPNFFLQWLVKQIRAKWFGDTPEADSLDLKQVEGLSHYAIFRLKDLEVHNAQNLAYANPVTLYMRTRFGLAEAVDWVAQAQLLILVKFEKMMFLRSQSIRTVLDLASYAAADKPNDPEVVDSLAEKLGVTGGHLQALGNSLLKNAAYLRLRQLCDALSQIEDVREVKGGKDDASDEPKPH